MSTHLKKTRKSKGGGQHGHGHTKVVHLHEIREAKIEAEKRRAERYHLNDLTEIYCLVGGVSPIPVELLELSRTGCSFRIREELLKFVAKDSPELCLEFLFTRNTRIRIGVFVRSRLHQIDKDTSYLRFGCELNQQFASYKTYIRFVSFVQAIAEYHALNTPEEIKLG
jgi:hypothetical protein